MAARGGGNEPQWLRPAWWDGFRSVRVHVGGKWIGLATTTYSYQLTQDEREEAAARLAALWSLAARRGWTTEQIAEGSV